MPTPSDSQDGARRRDDAVPTLAEEVVHLIGRVGRLEEDKAKLKQTIDAFPDANNAANLAHARAERDQLRSTVARLEAERDEARAELSANERSEDARLAIAVSELDEARAAQLRYLRELTATCSCGTSPMTYEGPEADCAVHGAVRAFNEAAAELARMRPVYEAVGALAEIEGARTGQSEHCSAWLSAWHIAMAAVLVAYDQTAPSSPLETPHTADGGEAGVVEGAGGSEAAEGSRMDCPERCEVPAGVRIVETPPSRHAWSDVVRCPNNGCEKTFLVIRKGADMNDG